MKKFPLFIFLLLILSLSACGYRVHGVNTNTSTILGNRDITISIGEIHQSTLYTWLPYFITNSIRDEIALRNIGKWANQGKGEYSIDVRVASFKVSGLDSVIFEQVAISSASIQIEFTIFNEKSGEIVWKSGNVSYSESYTNPREDTAIEDVIHKAVQATFDRLQNIF